MSPITAISLAGSETASLNPLVSKPTDVSVNWYPPTGSLGVSSLGLASIDSDLRARDEPQGPSSPDAYTSPGRLRPDRQAAGDLVAKQVSVYAEICADKAERVKTAIIDAYDKDTYEGYVDAVVAAETMAASVEGCPEWNAEQQTHAKAYIQGLVGAFYRSTDGVGWTGVQTAIDTAAKSLMGKQVSGKPDDGAETGDGSQGPDSETSAEESKASYFGASKRGLLTAASVAGIMMLQ